MLCYLQKERNTPLIDKADRITLAKCVSVIFSKYMLNCPPILMAFLRKQVFFGPYQVLFQHLHCKGLFLLGKQRVNLLKKEI